MVKSDTYNLRSGFIIIIIIITIIIIIIIIISPMSITPISTKEKTNKNIQISFYKSPRNK